MLNLIDKLFYPLLPGAGFIYLPYTMLLIFLSVTAAIIFLSVYFKRALKSTNWDQNYCAKGYKIFLLFICGWVILFLIVGKFGLLDSPSSSIKIVISIIIPSMAILWMSRAKVVTELLDSMPDALLINAQMFRLFFEPVTYLLFLEKYFPIELTLQGSNPEMVVAISAPVLIVMFFNDDVKRYWIAIFWNFFGIGSLIFFVYLLYQISPGQEMYWIIDKPLLVMASFPFILYPAFYIIVAFGLHVLSIRQLLRDRKNPIKYDISYLEPENN